MAITGGFGMTMDLESGVTRRWEMGRDGVKRWTDNGEPCEPVSQDVASMSDDQLLSELEV